MAPTGPTGNSGRQQRTSPARPPAQQSRAVTRPETTPARTPTARSAASDRHAPGTRTLARATGDTRANTATRAQAVAAAPSQRKRGGTGLRAKFMLVLAGITVIVMAALGVTLAVTSNRFLIGVKIHSGIELAHHVAQIGIEVDTWFEEQCKRTDPEKPEFADLQKLAVERLQTRLEAARSWGEGLSGITDIYSISFAGAGDFLNAKGIGELDRMTTKGQPITSIFVAKTGATIPMPTGIEVFAGSADYPEAGVKSIYRFKVPLGSRYGSSALVRVDLARESVVRVSRNLSQIIFFSVVVGIIVVVLVANWLATNITRPIDLLMRDMQIVARGDLNHQTKARSTDEIGVLATEFNKMTQNLAAAQSAMVEQEKAEYELSLAREVQRHLLPGETPQFPGYESAAFYQGAKAVSGDYFDFIQLGPHLWGFIVADVSGKGIPGSMVMAVTRTIIRLVANKHQIRAADTLREANRLITKQIKRGMFVTAFYAILNAETGDVIYTSAGHNPMVVYRHATKVYELAKTPGIALGFNEGPTFDKTIQEGHIKLAPGDAFVLYTDGFPEAMDSDNEEFGDERFYAAVASHGEVGARGMIQALLQEVAGHRGDAEQSDDLTIISVRRTS